MKGYFVTNDKVQIERVYNRLSLTYLKQVFGVTNEVFSKKDIENRGGLRDADMLFSTWGMEAFTKEEIHRYFPHLKFVFYAAGSVSHFAKPFLDEGIRVFSAWRANAIPVAEGVFAEIMLAGKGVFPLLKKTKRSYRQARRFAEQTGGNFQKSVGLLGVGAIGSLVATKLKDASCTVYAYDPFLTSERAAQLDVRPASLEKIFSSCDIISNHLADKDELVGVISGELLSKMKPYATFLNSGRGRQVDEKGLLQAMRQDKTRTAILDVTAPEPPSLLSPLRRQKNIFLTPHILGSIGSEVERMGDYMVHTAAAILADEPSPNEVTMDLFSTLA